MKGKHSKNEKNSNALKIFCLILIFLVLVLLFFAQGKNLYINRNKKEQEKEEKVIDISNEITVENKRLVLKSNFEENREKKIIYIFEDNILLEVRVLETYTNEDNYNVQKERNMNKKGIEIIENNDSELKIYYKRLKQGSDEGLSYQEIYDKYMSIIGAYEVI